MWVVLLLIVFTLGHSSTPGSRRPPLARAPSQVTVPTRHVRGIAYPAPYTLETLESDLDLGRFSCTDLGQALELLQGEARHADDQHRQHLILVHYTVLNACDPETYPKQ